MTAGPQPTPQQLIVRRDGPILWLVLNRPDRKNAISTELRDALLANLATARSDDSVRVIVITGSGDAFCAGLDLGGSTALSGVVKGTDTPWAFRLAMKVGIQRIIEAIWTIEKPVIAAVNGVAAGAGAQLALACDLIVAGSTARFIEIFARRGLAVDSGGGWLLPRLIFLRRAKELVFFGDSISAEDALAWGLVHRVVENADLRDVAGGWARSLARSSRIGAAKMLVNSAFDTTLAGYFERENVIARLLPDDTK